MAQTKTSLANLAFQHIGEGPAPSFVADIDAATSKAAKLFLNCVDACRKTVLRAHPWNFATRRATIALKVITGAANAAGLIRLTSVAHGFSSGESITVVGVEGTTEANGTWTITVISVDTFDLVASAYVNAYTSGGSAGRTPENGFTYKYPVPTEFVRIVSIEDEPEFEIEGRFILADEGTLNVKYVKDIFQGITDYSEMDANCFYCLSLYIAWSICYAITQSNSLKADLWKAFKENIGNARHVDATESSQKQFQADEWDLARQGGSNRELRKPWH